MILSRMVCMEAGRGAKREAASVVGRRAEKAANLRMQLKAALTCWEDCSCGGKLSPSGGTAVVVHGIVTHAPPLRRNQRW